MPKRDLIVVGASAGGVEALCEFVGGLPADLDAAVAVVLHLPAGGTSALPAILDRSGPLPAVSAVHGMPLRRGRVHVAPPDHHLIVVADKLYLSHGSTENGHRPAVDALFRSAAAARGPGVIGVVLSGTLDDGTAGMVSVSARGGMTLVQDPEEALFPGMPNSVLRHVVVDHVLPTTKMGTLLSECAGQPVDATPTTAAPDLLRREAAIASGEGIGPGEVNELGVPSGFSCPDCHGSLVELDTAQQRFRCQVGHGWTADALLDAQGASLEKALWMALRTLEEKARLVRRMRSDASARGSAMMAERYRRTEEEANTAADVLRRHLLSGGFGERADTESTG